MSMMVICSSCQRELHLPEELLGKMVKCPACGSVFTADSASPGLAPERPEEAFSSTYQASSPVQLPNEPYHDSYEKRIDRRKRRRGRLHREALDHVRGPAIGLVFAGIINWVESVLVIAFIAFFLEIAKGGHSHGTVFERVYPIALLGVYAIVGIMLGAINFFAARRMMKLTGYKFAMTSSILAVIPLGPCWMIRVPFGIWSIVVLCKPEVKAAFS